MTPHDTRKTRRRVSTDRDFDPRTETRPLREGQWRQDLATFPRIHTPLSPENRTLRLLSTELDSLLERPFDVQMARPTPSESWTYDTWSLSFI